MSKLAQFLKSTVEAANPANPANPENDKSQVLRANSANPANPDDSRERISSFSNISRGVGENSFLVSTAAEPDDAPLSAAQESARRQVLAQLEAHPSIKRAFVNRFNPDGTMVVTLAIRGIGTGELLIPADRFSASIAR